MPYAVTSAFFFVLSACFRLGTPEGFDEEANRNLSQLFFVLGCLTGVCWLMAAVQLLIEES